MFKTSFDDSPSARWKYKKIHLFRLSRQIINKPILSNISLIKDDDRLSIRHAWKTSRVAKPTAGRRVDPCRGLVMERDEGRNCRFY